MGTTFADIEKHIAEEVKNLGPYEDAIFEYKDGEYLDPAKYETIEDCEITPGQIILGDFKET